MVAEPSRQAPDSGRGPLRSGTAGLLALAGLLLAAELLLRLAPLFRAPLTVDVGPATGEWLAGAVSESLEYPPISARLVNGPISLDAPLLTRGGPANVRLRYASVASMPVRFELTLRGAAADFRADAAAQSLTNWDRAGRPGSPFGTTGETRISLTWPEGPLHLELRPVGVVGPALGLDWIRVEGLRWRLPLSAPAPRLVVAAAFGLAWLAGFGWRGALAAGGTVALAVGAWAAADPFGLLHVASRLLLPVSLGSAAIALALRGVPAGRWVTLLAFGTWLFHGALLLHPRFYAPDVLTHARYVAGLAGRSGSLGERWRAVQEQMPHRRTVEGEAVAFPYSPLPYLPFTALPMRRAGVEQTLKQAAAALTALHVVLVFFLARALLGGAVAPIAALLAATSPVITSRAVLALWPALAGHLTDVAALVAAAHLVAIPASRLRWLVFALATQASMLLYVGSLLTLGAFTTALAALRQRLAFRLLLVLAFTLVIAVTALYLPFARRFVTELVPEALASGGDRTVSLGSNLGLALGRLPLFFGWAYLPLPIAGLVVAARRDGPAGPVLGAMALGVLGLCALRGGSPALFKDVKDVEFATPVVTIASALVIEELRVRHRLASVLLLIGLVVWGLAASLQRAIPAFALDGL